MNFKGRSLTRIASGGNSEIYETDEGTIVKRLINLQAEKRHRFENEINILKLSGLKGIDNIVQIIDTDFSHKNPMYEMKKYCGDASIEDVLKVTRNNVDKTVSLMLPVVKTLAKLENDNIFHRDLKPENILLEKKHGQIRLILADFGCAYSRDFNFGNRITDDFRAVGAMAYRAPEYQYGKVDKIDWRGDVFSIGKLLWYFVNGVKGEVFPYALWYPERYSLLATHRCAGVKNIERLNLLIASATHHNIEDRICYSDLINQLNFIITDGAESNKNMEIKLLQHEQVELLRVEEEVKIGRSLALMVYNDIKDILVSFAKTNAASSIIQNIERGFKLDNETLDSKIESFVNSTAVGAPLASVPPMRGMQCFELSLGHDRKENTFPYVRFNCKSRNNSGCAFGDIYCFRAGKTGILIEESGRSNSALYNKAALMKKIESIIEHIAS